METRVASGCSPRLPDTILVSRICLATITTTYSTASFTPKAVAPVAKDHTIQGRYMVAGPKTGIMSNAPINIPIDSA